MLPATFRCYLVDKLSDGRVRGAVCEQPTSALPEGDVTIQVAYSSLNYKDALAATGHPGVARRLPHVPGIDAAGTVIESRSPDFRPGDQVLVTGYELGAGCWGGFSELIRVPADWIVPLPAGMSCFDAMTYGTAGFTAALSLSAIIHHGIEPGGGEVVVTGASGGVGCLAVGLLAKAGYHVVAASGKATAHDMLLRLGAQRVIGRAEVHDTTKRPLLPGRWSAAVDTVGGDTLATLVRSMEYGGIVAACGLVGGTDLGLSVYPFLLRGVTLAGIASAGCPMAPRKAIWGKLANPWKLAGVEHVVKTVDLEHLGASIAEILAGQIAGRVVVTLSDALASNH